MMVDYVDCINVPPMNNGEQPTNRHFHNTFRLAPRTATNSYGIPHTTLYNRLKRGSAILKKSYGYEDAIWEYWIVRVPVLKITQGNYQLLPTMDLMCTRDGSSGSQRPGPGSGDNLQSHSSIVTRRKRHLNC